MPSVTKSSVVISDSHGNTVKVNRLISSKGGEGNIYHATYRGKDYALKYFKGKKNTIGSEKHQTILKIVGEDKSPDKMFIWPLLIVNPSEGSKFGYLMELLPDSFYELDSFYQKDSSGNMIGFTEISAILNAGMNLAYAMRKIHLSGWSYKDLSANNVTVNPKTGEIRIIDNDNVSVDELKGGVYGTHGFMAPEIFRSGYTVIPSRKTDYYSLAVILYMMFYVDHPMSGKRWVNPISTDDRTNYYSNDPIFHFDPDNDKNRPDEYNGNNAFMRRHLFPEFLMELFVKSFTEGINNPDKRITDNKWIQSISEARDKYVRVNIKSGNGLKTVESFVDFKDIKTVPPLCLGLKIENSGKTAALFINKNIFGITIDNDIQHYDKPVAFCFFDKEKKTLSLRKKPCGFCSVIRIYSSEDDNTPAAELTDGMEYPLSDGIILEFLIERKAIRGSVFDPHIK